MNRCGLGLLLTLISFRQYVGPSNRRISFGILFQRSQLERCSRFTSLKSTIPPPRLWSCHTNSRFSFSTTQNIFCGGGLRKVFVVCAFSIEKALGGGCSLGSGPCQTPTGKRVWRQGGANFSDIQEIHSLCTLSVPFVIVGKSGQI